MSNSLEELGRLYIAQLTKGCKNDKCPNMFCARNITSRFTILYLSIVPDKKMVVTTAVEMAKNGTICGCPYVNRLYNCKQEEIVGYIPKSVIEKRELTSKALKYGLLCLFK